MGLKKSWIPVLWSWNARTKFHMDPPSLVQNKVGRKIPKICELTDTENWKGSSIYGLPHPYLSVSSTESLTDFFLPLHWSPYLTKYKSSRESPQQWSLYPPGIRKYQIAKRAVRHPYFFFFTPTLFKPLSFQCSYNYFRKYLLDVESYNNQRPEFQRCSKKWPTSSPCFVHIVTHDPDKKYLWWCIYYLNYLPLREVPHAVHHVTNISSCGAFSRRFSHEIMIS